MDARLNRVHPPLPDAHTSEERQTLLKYGKVIGRAIVPTFDQVRQSAKKASVADAQPWLADPIRISVKLPNSQAANGDNFVHRTAHWTARQPSSGYSGNEITVQFSSILEHFKEPLVADPAER